MRCADKAPGCRTGQTPTSTRMLAKGWWGVGTMPDPLFSATSALAGLLSSLSAAPGSQSKSQARSQQEAPRQPDAQWLVQRAALTAGLLRQEVQPRVTEAWRTCSWTGSLGPRPFLPAAPSRLWYGLDAQLNHGQCMPDQYIQACCNACSRCTTAHSRLAALHGLQ